MSENKKVIYPTFDIEHIKNPSKFYAFPILGFCIKLVISIPVFIVAICYSLVWFVLWTINSFIILFTGDYWEQSYTFSLGFMRYYIKIYMYLLGLSNTYPGFSMDKNSEFDITIAKPSKPNRILAIPIIGLLIRLIALIPFTIFQRVMQNGMYLSLLIAWYPILTEQKFPQSLFEFERDAIHVMFRKFSFICGLSDSYPSFHISMNNKNIKIVLLILAGIMVLFSLKSNWFPSNPHPQMYHYAPYNR